MGETMIIGIAALCMAVILAAVVAAGMIIFPACGGENECVVLPVCGHVEDIELRVRAAASHRRRLRLGKSAIFIVNFGADGETAEIARKLCRELEMVNLVAPDELAERLREAARVREG